MVKCKYCESEMEAVWCEKGMKIEGMLYFCQCGRQYTEHIGKLVIIPQLKQHKQKNAKGSNGGFI